MYIYIQQEKQFELKSTSLRLHQMAQWDRPNLQGCTGGIPALGPP